MTGAAYKTVLRGRTAILISLLALAGCAEMPNTGTVRAGPQGQSPSGGEQGRTVTDIQTLGAAAAAAIPDTSVGSGLGRQLFETYCLGAETNTGRALVIEQSGRFGDWTMQTSPDPQFSDLVFVTYPLRDGTGSVGIASRMGREEFCVARDGTDVWTLAPN